MGALARSYVEGYEWAWFLAGVAYGWEGPWTR